MKYFDDFQHSGESFEDREEASSVLSAIGRVGLELAKLHADVDRTISALSGEAHQVLHTEELTFSQKLEMLRDLVQKRRARVRFNVGDLDDQALFRELIELLGAADRLSGDTVDPALLNGKAPEATAARIMDVADYVVYADCMLEEFFLDCDSVH